jgi:RNA polymerase sigma factor (sigma-70 family)
LRLTLEQRELVERNRGLAHRAAHRIYSNNPLARCYGTEDDVVQDGLEALCYAAVCYDPGRGVKFATYAYNSILYEIWKKLQYQQIVHVPSGKAGSCDPCAAQWKQEFGEFLVAREEDHDWTIDIAEKLSFLKPRHQTVIVLHFGLQGHRPRTLEAVGAMIGVTKERARQYKVEALAQLRELLGVA